MPYAPFHEKFQEIAEAETRTLIIAHDPVVPDGEYGLIEMYCNDPGCDCRRVMFNVSSWRTGKTLAVIAYGWESKAFYAKWFRANDPEIIKEMQGPILNSMSPQSKFAPVLLEKVQRYALTDKKYVNRLKRHYQMFRDAIDREEHEHDAKQESISLVKRLYRKLSAKTMQSPEDVSDAPTPASKKNIGRNAPCPCGSGKKYKKCCGQ